MSRDKVVSQQVVRRLPRYYRQLTTLLDMGIERISSMDLASQMNVTASQIRQDLNNFGCFGQQGYGYSVKKLHENIANILGLGPTYNLVIIGGGNMGSALAGYPGFPRLGFKINAIFDKSSSTVGKEIAGLIVKDMSELEAYSQVNTIDIAVLTLRDNNYEEIAKRIFAIDGLRAVWNFTASDLRPPEGIVLEDVHLSDSLMMLSYGLKPSLAEECDEGENLEDCDPQDSP